MAKLQDTLDKMFGQLNIAQTQLPEYFETGLNPSKRLRPYQEECMKYFLTYMNPDKNFYGKQRSPHLLFHMATGSGKTMMMALPCFISMNVDIETFCSLSAVIIL